MRTRATVGVSALIALTLTTTPAHGQKNPTLHIGGLPLYSDTIQSRAITKENQTGAKGAGGQEGDGRKGAPCLWNLKKDQVYTFAEIEGPAVIRHIWITTPNTGPLKMRNLILRFYWDGQEQPSVEAPLTDFFGITHGKMVDYESEFFSMPGGRAFNSFIPMPFRKSARLDICNETGEDASMWFYQVDYTIGDEVTEDTPYFHAQFRRVANTTMYEDYVILDGVKGKGRFMGCNFGLIDRFADIGGIWWGEGEVKMYIDGDEKYPTICGTGAEDYIGYGWGLDRFTQQYFGAPIVDGKWVSCYRYHVVDPVYFTKDLKVTIQQIGNDGQYEPQDPEGRFAEHIRKGWYRKDRPGGNFERVDDVCSTAYWYQTLPTQPFPPFPDKALRSLGLEGK